MENKKNNFYENQNLEQKESQQNPLIEAYQLVHRESPRDKEDWQIAERIIEVLDSPDWIPSDLAKECLYYITHSVSYPDNETKRKIVLSAEEIAGDIFSELAGINEVHMDQIDYVYNKWKKEQK